MKNAIEAAVDHTSFMSFYGSVDVQKLKSDSGLHQWKITFLNRKADLPQLDCKLTGTVRTIVDAVGERINDVFFTLSLKSRKSPPISHNATANEVKLALESILGSNSVSVSSEFNEYSNFNGSRSWLITFVGNHLRGNFAEIRGHGEKLHGSNAFVKTKEVVCGIYLSGLFCLKVKDYWTRHININATASKN